MENHKESSKCPEYETYFNTTTLRRRKTPLRASADNFPKTGENIYMSCGFPNTDIFPILQTEMKLRDGTRLTIDEEQMKIALQYGTSNGVTELLDWIMELVKQIHNPPTLDKRGYDGKLDVMMVAGCQDGISKCFQMLLSEGDTLLVQSPSYAAMFFMVEPLGCSVVGVESDKNGIIPSKMRSLLEDWEENNPLNRKAPRPRVFYCVPTGENPRSNSWSDECRKEVYQICRDFDMLIIEDDPYYLTYYTRPLPTSLLSIDEDGRVLRFDSFSKVLSPGMRIGYMTGPEPIIDKMVTCYESSTESACQLSQIMLLTMLRYWGHDGFLKQGLLSANIFKGQAKLMVDAAETYLSDVADWVEPTAGMFLWFRLKHVPDSTSVVSKCYKRGVLIVAGIHCLSQTTISPYIRISFALVTREEMVKACQIIAEVAQEEGKMFHR